MQVFYNGSKDSVDGYICHKKGPQENSRAEAVDRRET